MPAEDELCDACLMRSVRMPFAVRNALIVERQRERLDMLLTVGAPLREG